MSSVSTFSSSTTEFRTASATKQSGNTKFSFNFESVETYILLGFTDSRASTIWGRYLAQPDEMGADFIDFARWAIEEPLVADAEASTDDWESCMDSLGIGSRLKDAVMIEEFEDIRYTGCCPNRANRKDR